MWRLLAAVLVLIGSLPCGATVTAASWTDREHVTAGAAAAGASCTREGRYRTVGRSRFLSGSIAGASLDPVAALHGIEVANSGVQSSVDGGAVPLGDDAYRAPLSLSAAGSAFQAQTGLSLPVAPGTAGVGAIDQWAQARSAGDSAGASGAVTRAGAIDTTGFAPSAPTDATVDLSAALTAASVAPLPALSSVTLSVGAIAASASARTCAALWGLAAAPVDRDYRISSLRLDFGVDAVSTLNRALVAQRTTITGTVAQLAAPGGTATASVGTAAANGLATGVTQALGPLGLISPSVVTGTTTVDVGLDPAAEAAVDAVLGESLSDPSGLVTVRFDTGRVVVDLSVLGDLNGRPANTALIDPAGISRVSSAVGQVVALHVARVRSAWAASASAVTIRVRTSAVVSARVALLQTPLATVAVDVSGTAAQFAAGTEPRPQPTVVAVNGWTGTGALTAALTSNLLQTTFFAPLESSVATRIAAPIGAAVDSAGSAAGDAATTAAASVVPQVRPIADVVSVVVNVQPDRSPFPVPYSAGVPTGATSVSAVRVTLMDHAVTALSLSLASASVGPNATMNG